MRGLRRREAVVMDSGQKKGIAFTLKDDELMIMEPFMQKKVGPIELAKVTHFSPREIKFLYRDYKATAPSTIIHRDLLRSIFREFFRRGDVEHYADLVFNAINTSHSGYITFSEYLTCLSMLCRGSLDEKIEWMYRLYDPMGRGFVSCERVQNVLTAVTDLLGAHKRRFSRPEEYARAAQKAFIKFTPDIDGTIRKEEFFERCRTDPSIVESIDVFRSVLFK